MDANHLSNRLAMVAKYVPQDARVADIGSDHAYLPAALLIQGQISYAIAGEVAQGPFENEQKEIRQLNLQDRLVPRLADGLAAVHQDDYINVVTIAGMGGSLIARILDEGQQQLTGVRRLVLQPNVGEYRVREWLMKHQYQIMAEQMLEEDGHIYEIIVAEPTVCPVRYSIKELLFGPLLLEKPTSIFEEKWQQELERCQQAVSQMKKATIIPIDRLHRMQLKVKLIQEALNHDDGD
ncbi:tRNA (adenine(22)-N(1))-methyltransferase TrmK [uncultured Limosilactobacillus sp.]|uniref:tRNA (adenine(22)-N(1))-methyltransferase n=1 Tax=uncultured Limosilactobacillus sp. TaxID=2837629 RepID=UPI0025FBA3EA|nr:tRNA (adenine(22)-N(1))-methyltransferase TrmK [uncultured Limosilactobacillus sp.]